MDWFLDFGTLLASVAAVVVSVIALWRSTTPKLKWEFQGVSVVEAGIMGSFDPYSNRYLRTTPQWRANFIQRGPGSAEQVLTAVQLPGGDWTPDLPFSLPEVPRGNTLHITLCEADAVPGTYTVRIKYRQLPNTRREYVWTGKAEVRSEAPRGG